MEKLLEQAPQGYDDKISSTDIFSQVIGQEKCGHMRMYGLGVCPSDLYGEIPSRSASYRMAMEFKSNFDIVSERYEELSNEMKEMRSLLQSRGFNNPNSAPSDPVNTSSQPRVSSPMRRQIRVI